MPRVIERAGLLWARPWLDQPRETIEAYVRRHRLAVFEDASNAQPRFARSRLRTAVWPALVRSFPDAEVALVGAACRAQEAQAALADYARADLRAVCEGPSLRVSSWLSISPARRTVVLRLWLDDALPGGTPQTLIDRLQRELPCASSAARWPAAGGTLALHGGLLQWMPGQAGASGLDAGPEIPVDLSCPGTIEVPEWGGAFQVRRGSGGLAQAVLREAWLRPRVGGERFAIAADGMARSLKKQYQAAGVPAWGREGPLVWMGTELLFAPALGIDARAARQHPGSLRLEWVAGAPPKARPG